MLQVIISPAKQMRIVADTFAPRGIPPFPARTEQICSALRAIERTQGAKGLRDLWRVNDKLLAENVDRLHDFVPVLDEAQLDDPAVARTVSAAVFSYVGIQYRSMAPEVMGFTELEWLQEHLWILSGFYGCVRPFDAVAPYRLEMGAKLTVDGARDLYAFWGDAPARTICEGDAPVCVVNLASVEYAKAVLPHLPEGAEIVTCVFGEDLRSGRPVQRATASKIARGSMVRWMAEHGVEEPRELEQFDVGYRYSPELSSKRGATRTLVFMNASVDEE